MKKLNKVWLVFFIFSLIAVCILITQALAQENQKVYVADFIFDAQAVSQEDDSRQGPFGLPRPPRPELIRRIDEDRAVGQAEDLVRLLSVSLVNKLKEKGISASRVSRIDELGNNGILVQGEFLDLDEGDPLKRAAVGLGSGATNMQIKVMISRLPLNEGDSQDAFDLQSSTGGKTPGGLLGLAIFGNPYAIAAKFVISKHDPEKDMQKLASEIAGEIQKYLQR